jgi:hypothetical protein
MAFVAAAGYARLELSAGGRTVTPASPHEALAFLDGLECRGADPPKFPERSCAVALLSDFWWEEPGRFLMEASVFRARGGELALVHLLEQEEVEPSLAGSWVLVDAESGERKKLYVGEKERWAYRAALQEHCAKLRGGAGAIGAPYALVRADESIDVVLFERLRVAGVLD